MADDKKNVFISHIHEDDAGLIKLKDLLKKHGMEIRDSPSTPQRKTTQSRPTTSSLEFSRPQINWASTLLVYITPHTKGSDSVDWEIEYAQKMGKRIVGVWAHGHNECEIPDALNDYGDAVVSWNGPQIIDAINGANNDWQKPDRSQCAPRPIKRYSC